LKALCIYNPKAGNGKAGKQLGLVKKLFDTYKIDADIILTQYPHHGTKILSEIDLSPYKVLIIAGGDGSMFDAVNAYVRHHLDSQIPVGLLPVGTGNSLSKDISPDTNSLESFIKIIRQGHIKHFDLGQVTTTGHQFYFINMTGFGFTTDVTLTGVKYKYLGDFAYTLGVLLNLIRLKSYPLQMIINGQTVNLENTYVTISNSKFAGGKMMVAPKASVNDGLLDIVIVNKVSRLQLLKTFPKIFDGTYIKSPYVKYYRTNRIRFTSNHKKILSPDGEIVGKLPAEIRVLPQILPILVDKVFL